MKHDRLKILAAICDLPTAPFREDAVIAWLLRWAANHPALHARRDRAGNVYVEYRRGRARANPLVIEAHMDHPGFIVERQRRDGTIDAVFRGGVRPSCFNAARVRLWLEESSQWIATRVLSVKPVRGQRHLRVVLARPSSGRIPAGTLGMWDLPDAHLKKGIFSARVCDDLAGVAAMVCMIEELLEQRADVHLIALFSRAEEVGFAGVLAVCERGWIPKESPVIGLETSKAFPASPQGGGPIIRVGDRTGIFSAGLTHFITQAAGRIADDDGSFTYQRKLMDGGTCNTTAFAAYGYDAAGICLALGNYHNMTVRGEIGYGAAGSSRAGPAIGSETIHFGDFASLVRLLTDVVRTIGHYKPGLGAVRQRLAKMHIREQKALLYAS